MHIFGAFVPFLAKMSKCLQFLGSDFGRTDFSRIFIFGPPDFFADFLTGFFLRIFVGKSAQKNPPGKSPRKSSKTYTTKILRHTNLQIGWGNSFKQIFGLLLLRLWGRGGQVIDSVRAKMRPTYRLYSIYIYEGGQSSKSIGWSRRGSLMPRGKNCRETIFGRSVAPLSGPLNRLNAILSLLHPLDRYRTPSAIGNAIGRPYLALSRIQTQVGVLNRLVLNRNYPQHGGNFETGKNVLYRSSRWHYRQEKIYFRIIFTFHSRYRYRRKCFWN